MDKCYSCEDWKDRYGAEYCGDCGKKIKIKDRLKKMKLKNIAKKRMYDRNRYPFPVDNNILGWLFVVMIVIMIGGMFVIDLAL